MKTLIKWPGGKRNEIKHIRDIIPEFDNYVEPFLGGGALFFDLEPENAYINDLSCDLIQFYKILANETKSENLKKILEEYNTYWMNLKDITVELYPYLSEYYTKYKNSEISKEELKQCLKKIINEKFNIITKTFPEEKIIYEEIYRRELVKNLFSKINRTLKLDLKHDFSDDEIFLNMETAVRSSFYMHERYIMNRISLDELEVSPEENTANYYFIREYCYGSMFRYNSKGEFNIPYGGISYNKKDFSQKIRLLFDGQTKNLLKNKVIENMDFESFLNKYSFTEKDFIFFDPPYDTDFSSYAKNSFTLNDHKRLAECICNLKCKFILIIKNTDYIYSLYSGKGNIHIDSFDKNYTYNVKSRNNRQAEHLIIHNIPEDR